MGNIFNDDYRDFLSALNEQEVKYLLVGGFSVILHGYSRTTGDMDIWVERSLCEKVFLPSHYQPITLLYRNRPGQDICARRGKRNGEPPFRCIP
jgi:hypothetical protein